MSGSKESVGHPSTAVLADSSAPRAVLRSERRFEGRVQSIRSDVVDLGDGQVVERDVVEHPGAVGVVAVDEELRVLLVHQYRHPVGALLWEAPAGLRDVPGEDPLETAARELFEEAGYRAREWAVLIDAFTSPGGSDEAVRIYLARGLSAVEEHARHVGDGEERDMPTLWVPLADARQAVLEGKFHNALCIMGVFAAAAILLDGVAPPSALRPTGSLWFGQPGS